MREDLNKRISLAKRFDKLISLGLWSDSIPQPDGQILERIQRLNKDIEAQIFDLYLPENQKEHQIKAIKKELYDDSKSIVTKKVGSKAARDSKPLFLGKEVSSWLTRTETTEVKLKNLGLPLITGLEELGKFLETDPNRLIWLIYHSNFTKKVHYSDFTINNGNSTRKISKPCPVMNAIQEKIKSQILDNLKFPTYVHGFVKGHNILDNAKEHQNANSIVTIDIKNFFDNITFPMVRSALYDLGYSGQISTFLALITTKQSFVQVNIGDNQYWNCSSTRSLPQGSTTSPGISNLVASKFDKQLFDRAKKINFKYSRYADDLTFSTKQDKANHRAILYLARKTLELHGFKANPKKTKILFEHHQQQVTGINLNADKPTIPREWRRNLRAAVHQFRFIKDKEKKDAEYLRIMGSIQHLKLTHPKKAKQYEIEVTRYYQIS